MNFLFALTIKNFKCSLTIPKFTNEGKKLNNISVFTTKIINNSWFITKQEYKEDKNFFYLNIGPNESENIFFLGEKNLLKTSNTIQTNELKPFYKIRTSLTFRAHLNIYSDLKEFSSYQSEYPFEMSKRTGSILTPVSPFINKNQNNIIAFKQIHYLPIKKPFFIYLVDLYSQKVLLKKEFYTNTTNILDLTKIKQLNNCCFYSENQLGIPIFISYGKKLGISMEHSHPPQLYLLSKNKFKIISNLKKRVEKIVSKSF